MDIIAEALNTPTVKTLYEEIEQVIPILIETKDSGNWWCKVEASGATICVTPTDHPAESLYHELLHIKLKLDGYRQYAIFVSIDIKRKTLVQICEMLDNELQHHRMFEKFIEAGFDPENFYHDDDDQSFETARKELEGMTESDKPDFFLLKFMTIIAPGGIGGDDQRQELKELIKSRCGTDTWDRLSNIEAEIVNWQKSPDLDASDTIADILRHLGGYENSWFGTSPTEFPGGGNFVDNKFTLTDVDTFNHLHGRP